MDRLIFFCLQYLNVESKYFKLLKAVKAITRSTDVNKIIVKFINKALGHNVSGKLIEIQSINSVYLYNFLIRFKCFKLSVKPHLLV